MVQAGLFLLIFLLGCSSSSTSPEDKRIQFTYNTADTCFSSADELQGLIEGEARDASIPIALSYGYAVDPDHSFAFTPLDEDRYALLLPLYTGNFRFALNVYPSQLSSVLPTIVTFSLGVPQPLVRFQSMINYIMNLQVEDGIYQFLMDNNDPDHPFLTITKKEDMALCHPTDHTGTTAFLAALGSEGLTAEESEPLTWTYNSDLFSVPSAGITVRNESITIWEYPSTILLEMDEKKIKSRDLYPEPFDSSSYYKNEALIVFYRGPLSKISAAIEAILGKPFWSQDALSIVEPDCGIGPDIAGLSVSVDDKVTVDRERYARDVAFIAQPRKKDSDHYGAVQAYCAETFTGLGYDVEYHQYGTGTNIIGVKKGRKLPNQSIIVSAHYDATGDCPGADDNASGVAGVLASARILSATDHDKTLIVACWDEEESRGIGSSAYAARARQNGESIENVYVYEMIGYKSDAPNSQRFSDGFGQLYPEAAKWVADRNYTGDFILIVHDDKARKGGALLSLFAQQKAFPLITAEVPCIDKSAYLYTELQRSDHSTFWDQDYPALMITDTANYRNPHYHCGGWSAAMSGEDLTDSVDTLDMDFAANVVALVTQSAAYELRGESLP